jgi:hypothetical protein
VSDEIGIIDVDPSEQGRPASSWLSATDAIFAANTSSIALIGMRDSGSQMDRVLPQRDLGL